jgi:tRNA G37 N-methylase Trm5/tRNA(Phe) wybutosine-synthesizing methylase Tyw3
MATSTTTVTELQQQQPSLMIHNDDQRQRQKQQQSHTNRFKNFAHAKHICLNGSKPDKSSAGRIDAHAVQICNAINALDAYYTTSSCSGRCFLYTGIGNKSSSSSTDTFCFQRFRVSHELIRDASRYFNLATLQSDPTGGGDEIFVRENSETRSSSSSSTTDNHNINENRHNRDVWLRFEPFILHVACRSLAAASALMMAARPAFKNVGLTSWKQQADATSSNNQNNHAEKYIVAIWGDEGLDMPLCMPSGCPLVAEPAATATSTSEDLSDASSSITMTSWLAQLVNERHERNWSKMARFVQAVRDMEMPVDDDDDDDDEDDEDKSCARREVIPRSYDVIGDVALLHKTKTANSSSNNNVEDGEHQLQRFKAMGEAIMKKNKAIKVVVLRQSNLTGPERAPGHDDNLMLLAGGPPERLHPSLITTHSEHGIACVVNLHETFFSPRMSRERQRICAQVQDNEDVLVLFAGVCMEALLIASKTRAKSVVTMECNPAAIQCARRSHRMLERNNNQTLVPGAAQRLEIVQGDVLQLLPSVPKKSYDRILAPRPKLGAQDGDLGSVSADDDGGGKNNASTKVSSEAASSKAFLTALLPVLKDGGVCHWYDFVADHEFPTCQRVQDMLQETCTAVNEANADDDGMNDGLPRCIKVLHVANAGSVAMRQLRVCIDFCIVPIGDKLLKRG